MNETNALVILLACAAGLGVCVVLRYTVGPFVGIDFNWAPVLLGIASLISLSCLAAGAYWLTRGYAVRLLPGSLLVSGGAIGFSICAGAVFLRRR
jgi:hypothetical protein